MLSVFGQEALEGHEIRDVKIIRYKGCALWGNLRDNIAKGFGFTEVKRRAGYFKAKKPEQALPP